MRVTGWLPFRTRVMAGYRHIKRGLDPVGADPDISKCVGGNLFCGTLKKETPLYQGADVHVIGRGELEAVTEMIRGIPLFPQRARRSRAARDAARVAALHQPRLPARFLDGMGGGGS